MRFPVPVSALGSNEAPSSIMKAGSAQHFEQAYYAQAAVDPAMLIVGAQVSMAPNDKRELVPTVAAISPVVANEVTAVLVDSGFYSEAAVHAIEQKPDGSPTGVTVYAAVGKSSHHKTVADLLPQPEPPAPGPAASAKEKMAHRLKPKPASNSTNCASKPSNPSSASSRKWSASDASACAAT